MQLTIQVKILYHVKRERDEDAGRSPGLLSDGLFYIYTTLFSENGLSPYRRIFLDVNRIKFRLILNSLATSTLPQSQIYLHLRLLVFSVSCSPDIRAIKVNEIPLLTATGKSEFSLEIGNCIALSSRLSNSSFSFYNFEP